MSTPSSLNPADTELCRERYGLFNASFFQMWTCSMCYFYIFKGKPLRYEPRVQFAHDLVPPLSPAVRGILLYRNLSDHVTNGHSELCQELGVHGCRKLKLCCQNAHSCCSRQIEDRRRQTGHYQILSTNQEVPRHLSHSPDPSWCPSTWDGYSCFQDTPPGRTVRFECPEYIDHRNTDSGFASKSCTENGTWWTDPSDGREWTDYTGCVNLEDFNPLYVVGIACNVVSLVCLIPACIIFLRFKPLRKQHRIRIHLNLFASFIVTNMAWLGWDHAIFRNRAEHGGERSSLMHQQETLCRILYVLTRYSWSCNFFWMSIEGFHLYRLINHAFKSPKTIRHYYFIGWLAPSIPFCLYCFLRFWKEHSGCWIHNAGYLEWIVYGPNLLCIVMNVAFLVNVLRILLTQLQTHPNEPSNYRRAFKATFILVPLFGIQLFLIIYRPYDDIVANISYEIIAKIIGNSQGAAVAIVFCFLNSEVHSLFTSRGDGVHHPNSVNEFRSCTYSTTGGDHRLDAARQSMESYPLKSPRNGFSRRELIVGMESPALSLHSRDGNYSDSSRIHMI